MSKQTKTVEVGKTVTIYGRYSKRPTSFKGETFAKESMVIPGQALTPLEILNQFKRGIPPQQIYIEGDAHQFSKMNQLEKLEFIADLKKSNNETRMLLKAEVEAMKKRMADQQKPEEKPVENKT